MSRLQCSDEVWQHFQAGKNLSCWQWWDAQTIRQLIRWCQCTATYHTDRPSMHTAKHLSFSLVWTNGRCWIMFQVEGTNPLSNQTLLIVWKLRADYKQFISFWNYLLHGKELPTTILGFPGSSGSRPTFIVIYSIGHNMYAMYAMRWVQYSWAPSLCYYRILNMVKISFMAFPNRWTGCGTT